MLFRSRSFLLSAAAIAAMGLSALGHAPALSAATVSGTLTWDPNGNGTDGSGTWDNTSSLWNNGTSDTTFFAGSMLTGCSTVSGSTTLTVPDTSGLTVGETVAGGYINGGTTISSIDSSTTLTLSSAVGHTYASGYTATFSGVNEADFGVNNGTAGTVAVSGTQYVNNIVFKPAAVGNYVLSGGTLDVISSITADTNVSAGIDSSLNSTPTLVADNGATLTLTGGNTGGGNWIIGKSGSTGIIDFKSGTYTPTIWSQGNVTQEDATFNLGGGRMMIGYGGASTWTINDPLALIDQTSGTTNNSNFIGRSNGTGVLNLEQGTIAFYSMFQVGGFDNYGGTEGTLNVSGGTLTMKSNNASNNDGTIFINYAGTAATESGTFNLSGGTVTAPEISFGDGGTFTTGSAGTLNVTDGNLYIGTGGIVKNASGTLNTSISLSGGTVGATANWSSSMAMTLGTTNGNITFQTADANNVANNIALSGNLSGAGGLNVTGGGVLTLSGTNIYLGGTTVSGGTLEIDGSQSNSNITIGSGATVDGSGTLTFNINNDTADLISDTDLGTLNISSLNLALNLTGTQTLSQYVLADYNGGTLLGSTFASVTGLQPGWSINYDDSNEIVLTQSAVPVPATFGLVALGAIGLLLLKRRRNVA